MNDFNIAAILLKNFDTDKWNSLPKETKVEIVNDLLQFRNRIVLAATMSNLVTMATNEFENAEKKYMVPKKAPVKVVRKREHAKKSGEIIKLVERKTESDYIAEGRMKIKWIEKP